MADNFKLVSTKRTTLTASVAASDTSMTVAAIEDREGNTLTSSDFGSKIFFVVDPGGSSEEHGVATSLSGTTLSSISNVTMKDPYTESSGFARAHPAGVEVVIYSNTPAMLANFASKKNDETIAQTWTFTSTNLPRLDTHAAPTADEELADKKYVDDVAAGGTATIDRLVPSATAGETVAAGDWVYFDTTQNEWMKTDASSTGTADKVMIGVAQGAGTDGNTISGGVMLFGLDSNQTGMTQGDIMYLSDTAGEISSSAGTVEVPVGIAISATEIYVHPRFNRTLTEADFDKVEAITATAAELNLTDGLTGTTALLNEATDFFNATDITGSEAESLTDGSLVADTLHHHRDVFGEISANFSAITTSETTVLSKQIDANRLGTDGGFRVRVIMRDTASDTSSENSTIRFKLGSTTVHSYTTTQTNGNTSQNLFEITCFNAGATGSQEWVVYQQRQVDISSGSMDGPSATNTTSSEDTTTNLNLIVTVQEDTNSSASVQQVLFEWLNQS